MHFCADEMMVDGVVSGLSSVLRLSTSHLGMRPLLPSDSWSSGWLITALGCVIYHGLSVLMRSSNLAFILLQMLLIRGCGQQMM